LLLKALWSYTCSKFQKSYMPTAAQIRVNFLYEWKKYPSVNPRKLNLWSLPLPSCSEELFASSTVCQQHQGKDVIVCLHGAQDTYIPGALDWDLLASKICPTPATVRTISSRQHVDKKEPDQRALPKRQDHCRNQTCLRKARSSATTFLPKRRDSKNDKYSVSCYGCSQLSVKLLTRALLQRLLSLFAGHRKQLIRSLLKNVWFRITAHVSCWVVFVSNTVIITV
jgi:hypothetical protein